MAAEVETNWKWYVENPVFFKCSYIVESNINAVVPSKLDCQFPSHAMPLYAILHSVAP